MITVVFFGSFQQYSVQILQQIHQDQRFELTAIVTTPPRPGDRGLITKTAVQLYAETHHLSIYPLESLDSIPTDIKSPDFIVVAGFGNLIPNSWLDFPKHMAINFHPSLLPNYAGRFPIEWAILNDESTIGASLIKMSEKFDKGDLVAQVSQPLLPTNTKVSLYTSLYDLGGQLITDTLPQIIDGAIYPLPQSGTGFYARQLTKDDGFVSSADLQNYSFSHTLDKKIRALLPWPGVWTYVSSKNGQKLKMKILSFEDNGKEIELRNVQIEGKNSTLWSEISQYYFLSK